MRLIFACVVLLMLPVLLPLAALMLYSAVTPLWRQLCAAEWETWASFGITFLLCAGMTWWMFRQPARP